MENRFDEKDTVQRHKLLVNVGDLINFQNDAEISPLNYEQVRSVHAILLAILRATNHGICLLEDQKFVWCNQAFSDMTGWLPEDIRNRSMGLLFPSPEHWARAYPRMCEKLKEEKKIDMEMEIVGKDGGRIPCMIAGRPLYLEDPTKGCLFSFTDFSKRKAAEDELKKIQARMEDRIRRRTKDLNEANELLRKELVERKRAEQALRESESRYRSVLEANPDPVVVYDMEGRVIFFNPAFEWVFGWSLSERRRRKMDCFVPDENWAETRVMVENVVAGRSFSGIETYRYNKEGEKIPVSISASIVRGANGQPTGSVATIRDIREQKKLEAQLSQSQKLEAIGTLAGGIAHDFNNLLMGIQGYASILKESDISQFHLEKLEKIEQFIQSGANLTRQILGFAKGGKYQVKPTDINEIVEKTADMFGRTKKQIVMHEKYGTDIHTVEVDRSQIEQVLLNLYVNAWQAMPHGGDLYIETQKVELDHQYLKSFGLKPGAFVKISVTDTGIGMDAETKDRIFDPFFTTKEIGRGTGLGLASSYGIIRNHGGFITVYSEKGMGSTFNIFLPASDKEVVEMDNLPESIAMGSGTILLVDDEEMVIEVGKELLEDIGYEVILAQDGREAVDIFKKCHAEIRLVILDMIMPGLTGGQTFDQIKKIDPKAKILLSSGYSISSQTTDLIEKGCAGFIEKPFSLKKLSQTIKKILEEDLPQ